MGAREKDRPVETPTYYRATLIDGISLFYREAGDPTSPTVVLLGGFPSSSHMFRDLIPLLKHRFHLIAPDYPGFGQTEMPDPATFAYTFDHLADLTEHLLATLGVSHAGWYVQDYGGPIGNRILGRHPNWLEWLIIQNANIYEEGFTGAWDVFRHALWVNRSSATEAPLKAFLAPDGVKGVYLGGAEEARRISPDAWTSDLAGFARPHAHRVQLDLFYDYRTNVGHYPKWQAFLRQHRPHTLIAWGKEDVFFTVAGALAYLRDIPEAEVHLLNAGHFALEDHHELIAALMTEFYDRRVRTNR
jgi:pimeloyl-ACP methyl ester carboxylesterase